jgi:hypothetical protein
MPTIAIDSNADTISAEESVYFEPSSGVRVAPSLLWNFNSFQEVPSRSALAL